MEIEPFEFRSPAELINEIAGRVPLIDGMAYAVLVHDPSRTQQIREIAELTCGSMIDDDRDARRLIKHLCARWAGDTWHRPSDLKVVTVVVRRGLCVWSPIEWTWSMAWRYANTGLSGGDLITVTEYGWYDFMTKHADHAPALMDR